MAPHVFVEDITVAGIRETREAYERGGLRERMARHHDDPDAAFHGWCDVWLDPAFRTWSLEADAALLDCPVLLIQGADDEYATLEQLDRIEAACADRWSGWSCPAGTARTWSSPRRCSTAISRASAAPRP